MPSFLAVLFICASSSSSSSATSFSLLERRPNRIRLKLSDLIATIGTNPSTISNLPFLLDHRGHEQKDDAGTNYAYHHPKHNEPRRGRRFNGGYQGGQDANELQSRVIEQEDVVDAVPGLSIGQRTKGVPMDTFPHKAMTLWIVVANWKGQRSPLDVDECPRQTLCSTEQSRNAVQTIFRFLKFLCSFLSKMFIYVDLCNILGRQRISLANGWSHNVTMASVVGG